MKYYWKAMYGSKFLGKTKLFDITEANSPSVLKERQALTSVENIKYVLCSDKNEELSIKMK